MCGPLIFINSFSKLYLLIGPYFFKKYELSYLKYFFQSFDLKIKTLFDHIFYQKMVLSVVYLFVWEKMD